MSSYQKQTQHPLTGAIENASWLDDYFGKHRYGVEFSDGKVFRADEYEWLDDPRVNALVPTLVSMDGSYTYEENGKQFTETIKQDGSKDVHVTVNKLDLKPKDAEEAHVKQVIEEAVLPRMEQAMVHVVVVHKPTNQSAHKTVPLPQVRVYAEACVKAFNAALAAEHGIAGMEAPSAEFCVIEVHHDTFLTRVTTLNGI